MFWPSKKETLDKLILFQVKVPSKSHPGTYHIITFWKNGTLTCDCEAAFFGNTCSHVLLAEKWYYKQKQNNENNKKN
jgi:hypothetical protein